MKTALKQIPNLITLLNLLSGSLSVAFIAAGEVRSGIILIALAAVFDFLDGLTARLLKVQSEMGKQLDTLADIISFGFAPSFLFFEHTRLLLLSKTQEPELVSLNGFNLVLVFIPFVFVLFAAIRLARFNIDPRQKKTFIGLPSPAAALLVSSALWIYYTPHFENMNLFLENPVYLNISLVFISFLMVAPLKFFSLKFNGLSWKKNQIRYLFTGISAILLITLQTMALPVIISIYIVFSIISNLKLINTYAP